jgi:hypothetical protein
MADEVVNESDDQDVEGQVLRNRLAAVRLAHDGDAVPDGEPKMTESDDDVEGQSLRTRTS